MGYHIRNKKLLKYPSDQVIADDVSWEKKT